MARSLRLENGKHKAELRWKESRKERVKFSRNDRPAPRKLISTSLARWAPSLSLLPSPSQVARLVSFAQDTQRSAPVRSGTRSSHPRDVLTPEAREMVDLASAVVCKEQTKDPKGSLPIDDMQGRPSLPVRSPEAVAGAERARRLLPISKNLVVGFAATTGNRIQLPQLKGLRLRNSTCHRAGASRKEHSGRCGFPG